MGGGPQIDHKFIGLICRQLQKGRRDIRAVDDKFGSPTYTHDFSRCLLQLATADASGLFHVTGGGGASRYDVALEVVRLLGFSADARVHPVPSTTFEQQYSARRPANEILESARLAEYGAAATMRPWTVALAAYLDASGWSAGKIRDDRDQRDLYSSSVRPERVDT